MSVLRSGLSEFRRQLSNKIFLLGFCILSFWVFVAVFAQYVTPFPIQGLKGIPDLTEVLKPPSLAHLFGTTELGLDLFSRVIFGARIALFVTAIVTAFAATLGYLLGTFAGYLGSYFDEGIMRVTDVFLAFPTILMAILIVSALRPGLWSLIIALALTRWPQYVRLARSQSLSLRQRNFVLAARGLGESRFEIIRKHIFLNALPPVLILATTDMGYVILADAGLSFLGLGLPPPSPDWGLTIAQSISYFPTFWWYATFPGLALLTLVIGFALVGDNLSERLDPRLAKMTSTWYKI